MLCWWKWKRKRIYFGGIGFGVPPPPLVDVVGSPLVEPLPTDGFCCSVSDGIDLCICGEAVNAVGGTGEAVGKAQHCFKSDSKRLAISQAS